MLLTLARDKLDVKNKNRSNVFNWRGQFTPQFIEYLLEQFSSAETILDPFCGSGTVLREGALLDKSVYGFEINPAAYTMSKFHSFSNFTQEKRCEIFDGLSNSLEDFVIPYANMPLFISSSDHRTKYKNLLECGHALLSQTKDKNQKLLALLMLFYAEDSPNGSISATLSKAANNLKKNISALPYTKSKIHAELRDARLSHEGLAAKVDLIITSPPYINVFNYHQNYRAILEILGFDMLKVASSEIGSNRQNRGNRFKTVVQYCLDMSLSIKSLADCIKPAGHLIMVMGRESKVRGISFYNALIVKELISDTKCFNTIGTFERVFINRFGENIYEDIIVVQKRNVPPAVVDAKCIAIKHLKNGLSKAVADVKEDLSAAIEAAPSVAPSPLFNRKDII